MEFFFEAIPAFVSSARKESAFFYPKKVASSVALF
jgi:hypothetical protein